MKKIIITILVFLIINLLVLGTIFVHQSIFQTNLYNNMQEFVIHSGESFQSVASRLENQGIISSAFILNIYARLSGTDSKIQKGLYIIPEHLSALQIVEYLSSGRQKLIKITIPEGKTIRQVAMIFEEHGVLKADEFMKTAHNKDLLDRMNIPAETVEGYLFPDTYYFMQDFPAENIIQHMINTFFGKLEEIYPDYIHMNNQELHEKIIMASIVEREYREKTEAPLIASVFYNRLERNIHLESCATIVYIMTEIENMEHPTRLFFVDLDRSSIFNTYLYPGLPPSPISGVGAVALSAAFFPAESNYLFFVLTEPHVNKHVFSEDYRQHLIASQEYYVKLN